MPHKVVKKGNRYYVRSWVTGKLLKRSYKSKQAAQRRAATSYRRSKRKRSRKSSRSTRKRGRY